MGGFFIFMTKSIIFSFVLLWAVYSQGQTNTTPSVPLFQGPLVNVVNNVSVLSNLTFAPYAIYDTGTKSSGGGLLILYNVVQWAAGGIGIQYLNKELWMPSAQLQLQAPLTIAGVFTATPFAFTGVGTPVAGGGNGFGSNGSAIGIFGAGLSIKLFGDFNSSHLDVFAAAAKWTGFNGQQLYGGLAWKF